jgi:2,4-dienoyl-CoA reductase-like NADH-dependent reductase (Old Yellow Enzyme family)
VRLAAFFHTAPHFYTFFDSFCSPLSNNRTDDYGGSFENRIRLALQIARRVREEWGEDKPLFVRVSATDWAEGPEKDEHGEWKQWGIEQTKHLTGEFQKLGVDLVDVSSGGNWAKQKITVGPGYQVRAARHMRTVFPKCSSLVKVPFAKAVKAAHPTLLVNAVGLITDPHQAEGYLQEGKADTVMLARALLRDADWVFNAAQALGVAVKTPNQYERAYTRMLKPQKL